MKLPPNFLLTLCAFFFLSSSLYSTECFPDDQGRYMYYCNVEDMEISNSFSKEDFLTLLMNSEHFDEEGFENFSNKILSVEKSFPTGATEFLQQSLSVYTNDNDLLETLQTYSDVFDLCEKICFPEEMLLYEPNDYRNASNNPLSHLELVKAPEGWAISTGDSRILAGITDTYIEVNHEDLVNKISSVRQNGFTNFHGVAATGCIAAETNNGKGVAATGFNTGIVFSSRWANDNEVLQIAQMPGVRVINCSWINSCSFSQTKSNLYTSIRDIHNVIVVAGAGNNANHCGRDNFVYPASLSSVISVTSVGHIFDRGHVDPTFGPNNWKDCHQEVIGDDLTTHHHNTSVNIAAPGYNVYTTMLNNTYSGSWGTSFASPMVAGACALVAAVNPCLTAAEIQNIVLSTADPSIYNIPENSNYTGLLGSGRLDIGMALKKALELDQVFIQNQTYSATTVENSETTMTVGATATNTLPFGNVNVNSGSDVTFEATHSIKFTSGFKVENNSTFRAKIYDSTCF